LEGLTAFRFRVPLFSSPQNYAMHKFKEKFEDKVENLEESFRGRRCVA
jgi:hypothetical protein